MVSSELKQLAASVNSNVDTMHHEVFLDHDDETKCLTQNGLPTDCPLFNCFVVFVLPPRNLLKENVRRVWLVRQKVCDCVYVYSRFT